MTSDLDSIRDDLSFLDDWEERYRYIIDLGRTLAPLSEDEHSETNQVRGCASQVWLISETQRADGNTHLVFRGDSDAHIVKGLVAVTLAYYSGQRARWIVDHDAFELFRSFGFEQHLTPQRSNGVRSMIDRIRKDAVRALAA